MAILRKSKFKNQKKLSKSIDKAIRFLASEFYYFKELGVDLNELKYHVSLAKKALEKKQNKKAKHLKNLEIRQVKSAFKDYKYIGRSQARFNKKMKFVIEAIEFFHVKSKSIKQAKILKEFHVEVSHLFRDASQFEGKIRDHLKHLKDEIKEQETHKLQASLAQLEEEIQDAKKWLEALQKSLRDAKKITKEHFQKEKLTKTRILEIMQENTTDQNVHFLSSIIEHTKDKKVKPFATTQLMKIASSEIVLAKTIANFFVKIRDYENAAISMQFHHEKNSHDANFFKDISNLFFKAKNFKKAGELALQGIKIAQRDGLKGFEKLAKLAIESFTKEEKVHSKKRKSKKKISKDHSKTLWDLAESFHFLSKSPNIKPKKAKEFLKKAASLFDKAGHKTWAKEVLEEANNL
jgi:hypothetical protein